MNKTLMLLALLASAAPIQAHDLLAPQAGDLAAAAVQAPPAAQASAGAPNVRREAVALSWASRVPVEAPAPHQARSREYYQEVSAAELAAGVVLHTTAPRAVVRLQPLAAIGPREALAIDLDALVVTDAAGHELAASAGMQRLVGIDKLAKADLPFAPGTSAFRLLPQAGSGALTLKAAGLHGATRYLLNVVEPDSPFQLALQADAVHYLHGQTLVLDPALLESDGHGTSTRHRIGKLDATLVSPGGRRFALRFKSEADGSLRARMPLDANEAPAPGLWEVQANGQASVRGQTVQRSLRLALPVAMPVARLDGSAAPANTPERIGLQLGLEVGAAGRYEVRALLYGTVDGVLAPLAVAQSAQWLEAGRGQILLGFDPALVSGASAPFELRELSLLDQGRVGVLHHQQRALVLDERDMVRSSKVQAPAPAKAAGS